MLAYLGFDCVVMIWFACFFVYFCDLVFLLLLVFFCFAGTARHFLVFPYITSREQRNSKATSLQTGFQAYQTNHHPNAKKHCKQFVEFARWERVVTARAEFHFSWVYTFSATPRSLRIWATHPPRETGCDPATRAQLCWSSSSFFPYICNTTSRNWTATKLFNCWGASTRQPSGSFNLRRSQGGAKGAMPPSNFQKI